MKEHEAEAKVLGILTRHVGRENAIGMGELYERIYGEPWSNRINDTRRLRKLITNLRYSGHVIMETRSRSGGGYYIPRSRWEASQYIKRRKHEAVRKLYMISQMEEIGLAELLGQMQLNLKEGRRPEG